MNLRGSCARTVDVVLLGSALYISAVLVSGSVRVDRNRGLIVPELAIGSRIDSVMALKLEDSRAPLTALVVSSPFCGHAIASLDALRAIIRAEREAGTGIRWAGVTSQSAAAMEEFMRRNHIRLDAVVRVPFGSVLTRYSPRLVIVDRYGVVKNEWSGRLEVTRSAEVTASILVLSKAASSTP